MVLTKRGLDYTNIVLDEIGAYQMKRYVKRPVEVWARRFDAGDEFSAEVIADWCGGYFYAEEGRIEIETLEGFMFADDGDYIIEGVQGEYYPCKPDIFEQTYKEVT